MATKSIGVQSTLKRSAYANPFIVSKKDFKLGESLKLYERWLSIDARRLTADEVQSAVDSAPTLPETIEEMLLHYPHLFTVANHDTTNTVPNSTTNTVTDSSNLRESSSA